MALARTRVRDRLDHQDLHRAAARRRGGAAPPRPRRRGRGALPGLALRDAAGAPIRWIDLATHRSGLPRLPTNLAPQDPRDPYAGYDEAQLLRFLRDFKPTVARDSAGNTRTSASACSAMRSAAPRAAAIRNCSPSACSCRSA
jgi:hypothetical protein